MSAAPGKAIILASGTLFWSLIIAGAVTGNNILIGVAVVLAVVTIGVTLTQRARGGLALREARKALWTAGTPARARVVSLRKTGARINHDPQVDLELAVQRPGQSPYTVTYRFYVSQLAIPRVQPDCELDVRVDPADDSRVAIDPSLGF